MLRDTNIEPTWGLHAISSRYSAIHSLCPPDMGTRYTRELNEVEEEGRAPPSNLDTVNHLLRECCDHKAVGLFTLAPIYVSRSTT